MGTCFSSSSSLTKRWILYYCSQIEFTPPSLLKSLCKHKLLSSACGRGHQCWKRRLRREWGSTWGKAALCWCSGALLLVLSLPRQCLLSSHGMRHLLATTTHWLHKGRSFLSPKFLLKDQTGGIWSPYPSFPVFPVLAYPGYLCLYLLWYLLCWKWKRHPTPDSKHPELTVQRFLSIKHPAWKCLTTRNIEQLQNIPRNLFLCLNFPTLRSANSSVILNFIS